MTMASVCITRRQRNLHVATEAMAVLFVAPLLGWIAYTGRVSESSRIALGAIVIGTLLVDGHLVTKYRRMG